METSRDINRESKKLLRKEILKKRDLLTETERRQFSSAIAEKVLNFSKYSESEIIFPFVSYGSEVDTHDLISCFLSDEKEVYCPKVTGERLEFYQILSLKDLIPGYKGILEPGDGLKKHTNWDKKILILMPGSVFDRNCNRMGYGKGFYDRFLDECQKRNLKFVTVALAFSMQLVENIPVEKHDYKPDYIITEKEILWL